MITPPPLKQGDKIGIMSPARKISSEELANATKIIEEKGFKVELGKSINSQFNQFAGSDDLRANDLNFMLNNDEIKAIIFARGGYGSVRIIDKINFESFKNNPKWLAGYSDITVFHSHLNSVVKCKSIHSSMPVNFAENTSISLNSLFDALCGKKLSTEFQNNKLNRNGEVNAEIIGGNLSVIYSLLGSKSFPDTRGKILFLEDLDEYLYHIDRMMMAFKRAGVFNNLAGLIIGAMSDMHDNSVPFGKTAEEIIYETVEEYEFPVAFNFPAGHIDDNRAIIMGENYSFNVNNESSKLISHG